LGRISKGTLQDARDYAFLLLKFRLRSEKELCERLKKKGFESGTIREVAGSLKSKGFIDDRLFAKAWIKSRLGRSLGLRRIRQELNLKGIDKEITDTYLNEVKKVYSEQDVVKNIAQERLEKLKGVEPRCARRRVYAYLLRRGFSPEIVIDALN